MTNLKQLIMRDTVKNKEMKNLFHVGGEKHQGI